MQTNYFDAGTLRKFRDQIISALKGNDVEFQRHYQLSSVNQLSTVFILTLTTLRLAVNRSANATISKIKPVLQERFPLVILRTSGEDKITIDFIEEYKQVRGDIDSPAAPSSPKPEEQTRNTFLKQIYGLVADKFFDGKDFNGKVTKYEGNKEVALLTLPKDYFYATVDYFMSRLLKTIPTLEKSIIVSKDKFSTEKDKRRYESFAADYKVATKTLSELSEVVQQSILYLRNGQGGETNFVCKTHASELALYNMEFRVAFTIADPMLANGVASILSELSIRTEKVGQIVYIQLDKTITVDVLKAKWKSFIEKPNVGKKGFVVEMKNGKDIEGPRKVYRSYDYSRFHFIPFNRPTIQSHVEELKKSMREFGFVDEVLIARTDVIDGIEKDWIVDRQHRFIGLVEDKQPIDYSLIYVHSKYELIRIIAALNSKSSKWQKKDYLRAWSFLDMQEYKTINKWKDKAPITIITQAMTGLDATSLTERFNEGTIQFLDVPKGEKVLSELLLLRKHLPKGIRYMSAATKFLFRSQVNENYSIGKLLKNISSTGLSFEVNDRDTEIISKLELKLAA